MDILVITTGGTFDKVYFDAKSDYQVGEPYVGNLLEEGNVTLNYEILSILKKDSLDIKEEDRILIKDKVSSATQDKIVIIHGTDTMIDTANVLEGINKTIVLTGSMQPARFKNSDATVLKDPQPRQYSQQLLVQQLKLFGNIAKSIETAIDQHELCTVYVF